MGNHSHVSSPRKLDFTTVDKQIAEINERCFQGYFRIERGYWGYEDGWCFHIEDREHPIFGFHITETKRKIEGGHPRPGLQWCYWAWAVFQNELGVLWNGRIGDEGVGETWAPAKDKYPTLNDYFDKTVDLDYLKDKERAEHRERLWHFYQMGIPDKLREIGVRE